MRSFTQWVVMWAFPLAVQAADGVLGKYHGLAFSGGTPLVVELHRTKSEFGNEIYAGTNVAPARNLSISLGASRHLRFEGAPAETASLLDPNSPAMQAFREAQIEKLTSVESSGWRFGPTLKNWKLGMRFRYYADRHKHELYQIEIKKSPLGGTLGMFTYRHEF